MWWGAGPEHRPLAQARSGDDSDATLSSTGSPRQHESCVLPEGPNKTEPSWGVRAPVRGYTSVHTHGMSEPASEHWYTSFVILLPVIFSAHAAPPSLPHLLYLGLGALQWHLTNMSPQRTFDPGSGVCVTTPLGRDERVGHRSRSPQAGHGCDG